MAHGTGVSGSGKWSVANSAPSALFCMPTCAMRLQIYDVYGGLVNKCGSLIVHITLGMCGNLMHHGRYRTGSMMLRYGPAPYEDAATSTCKPHDFV